MHSTNKPIVYLLYVAFHIESVHGVFVYLLFLRMSYVQQGIIQWLNIIKLVMASL